MQDMISERLMFIINKKIYLQGSANENYDLKPPHPHNEQRWYTYNVGSSLYNVGSSLYKVESSLYNVGSSLYI